jgi:hypothetical protein
VPKPSSIYPPSTHFHYQFTYHLRFQVLTAVSMMFRIVFWDVLPSTIFYTAVHPRRQFWTSYLPSLLLTLSSLSRHPQTNYYSLLYTHYIPLNSSSYVGYWKSSLNKLQINKYSSYHSSPLLPPNSAMPQLTFPLSVTHIPLYLHTSSTWEVVMMAMKDKMERWHGTDELMYSIGCDDEC